LAIIDLYNSIYRILANDPDILNYLGIGVGADNLTKAKKIQKRSKPQDLANNLPLITFYAPPGRRDNSAVYVTPFVFDIYTNDDVPTAHKIAQRIIDLFDGQLHPMVGVESMESYFITGHESQTDLQNTYCFTVVIEFSVSIK